ncbi:hypothetical protein CDCA_CDCA01G0144 [Cyanidium caldarium]|uniref:Replication protein A C-terminal domain-containing protein n=1 Tax=Cyanidium caldarium TaxID=2771 RepID=A0AAV9IP64_CYACA|nr:hypothetical protein CDCA_CDCA01G0144 [Cyanidium caldarium]
MDLGAPGYSGGVGGGFLPPAGGADGRGYLSQPGAGMGARDVRKTVLPVRLADLVQAHHDPVTNTFTVRSENRLDSMAISDSDLVRVVARVEQFQEQPIDLLWLLNDDSGEMLWARYAGGNASAAFGDLERAGVLVRVHGQVSEVEGKRVLNVRTIRRAEGGDSERQYHELQCRLALLQRTRGPVRDVSTAGRGNGALPGHQPYGAATASADAASGTLSGFTAEQSKVLRCIQNNTRQDRDTHVGLIAQQLGMNEADARRICSGLFEEGHIYCTLDDDTFRSSVAHI